MKYYVQWKLEQSKIVVSVVECECFDSIYFNQVFLKTALTPSHSTPESQSFHRRGFQTPQAYLAESANLPRVVGSIPQHYTPR